MRLSWLQRLAANVHKSGDTSPARIVETDPQLKWAEDQLHRLARIAWAPCGPPDSMDFLLDPSLLPEPSTARLMEQSLGALYGHALKWARGFEVPFRVPKVAVKGHGDAAGQYQVDGDGYLFIDITPGLLRYPSAVLAVLAHEACHHIIDISGLNTHRQEIDEPTTDLAMFVCGFGQVFRAGQSRLGGGGGNWQKSHLGYLTETQYAFAYQWVAECALRAGRLKHLQPA